MFVQSSAPMTLGPYAFWNPARWSPHHHRCYVLMKWGLDPITFNRIHIEASRQDVPGLQYAFDGVLTGSASSGARAGGFNSNTVLPDTCMKRVASCEGPMLVSFPPGIPSNRPAFI